MRLNVYQFPRETVLKSREKMRNVRPENVAKVGVQKRYWTLPFLIRLMSRVDETAERNPAAAADLAEPLPKLAESISVRTAAQYYESEAERLDFRMIAAACLFSALAAAGNLKAALRVARATMTESKKAGRFARAEVLRRAAYIYLMINKFAKAHSLAEEAAKIFHAEDDSERAALAHLYMATALGLRYRPGAGTMEFAKALYLASKTKGERAERVVIAAATNIARDTLFVSASPEEFFKWASGAREAMKGRPYNVAKLHVDWIEALAAYRLGSARYAANRLEKVRDHLLAFDAFHDAMSCTGDLIAIVNEYDRENLMTYARRSVQALNAATSDAATLAVLDDWAGRPSDVTLLRRIKSAAEVETVD